MRAGIRYLRNLGQFRRNGICSPVKRIANPSNFLAKDRRVSGVTINLDDVNSSTWCPEKQAGSPFGTSGERIHTINYANTHGRDLSLLELWKTDSPIDLNEDEQSYLDFTKEYRSFDENKFKKTIAERKLSESHK